jgi:predicted MFS family arabinose efflux permease
VLQASEPTEDALSRLRSRTVTSRDLVLLLLLVFIAGMCEFSIYVLVPLAADARGTSNAWVGVLVGTPQLMLLLALIPGTHFAASWRRRTVLALGIGLQGAAALGHAAITDPYWMLLPQLLLGLGLALFWPAYLSYFGSIVRGDTANAWQGRRAAVEGIALLVAPVGATMLAQTLGYQEAFAVVGGTTVAVALIPMLLMSPATRPENGQASMPRLISTFRQAGRMLKRPALLMIFGLISIGAVLIMRLGGPFLTLYLASLGFGQVAVGLLLSLQALSKVTLQPAFGRMARRVRPVYLLAFSILLTALAYTFLPVFTLPVLLAGILLVSGAVSAPYNPAMVGLVSDQFSDEERDLGMALWITVLSATTWLASPALGFLSDAVGLAALFPIAGLLVIVSTIVLVQYGRNLTGRLGASRELVELWR